MSIVIFSGTTEGRIISEYLTKNKVNHHVSVATESGEIVMEKSDFCHIHTGRMDENEMEAYLKNVEASYVFDATHPYAEVVTKTIKAVCTNLNISYVRILRDEKNKGMTCVEGGISIGDYRDYCNEAYISENADNCAKKLLETKGNILLTTGSKDLSVYTKYEALRDRIYVRVLPSVETLELCKKASIDERRIIAMYGPHSESLNEAIINQYNIKHLVTKESGNNGGYDEKVTAAKKTNCQIHIIKRPEEKEGVSLNECLLVINRLLSETDDLNKITTSDARFNISLVGIGAGSKESMTLEAKFAIDEADYIFGAKRMVDNYSGDARTHALYKAEDIIGFLDNNIKSEALPVKVTVLFSGDTGIYSGATKLYKKLKNYEKCENIKIIPGISSFSYFASKLSISYENILLMSLHGKSEDSKNLDKIAKVISEKKELFVLMSGKSDFDILALLISDEQKEYTFFDIGYNLSYDNERIIHINSSDVASIVHKMDEGLYIVRISYEE